MPVFRIALMANWGLGAEILRNLHRCSQVEPAWVMTHWEKNAPDPWRNIVFEEAGRLGIPVRPQEETARPELEELIKGQALDLLLVHAYPRRLPPSVFQAPRIGAVNIHASLLPRYRGPAPAYWVLKNRETRTGLTAHFITHGYDEGDIIHQVEMPVFHYDNMASLLERQKTLVHELLSHTFRKLKTPGFRPRKQDEKTASWAPRPNKKGDEENV